MPNTSHRVRPILLDLFCGAGGAGMGYHRAGFDVIGVDVVDQPDYPFPFVRWDALELGYRNFDAIHASPPCQLYTSMKTMWNHRGAVHPDLVAPTRELLMQAGVPWVMENVPGAPMEHSVMLCGTMFGLGTDEFELRRHRVFETSFAILGPTCQHTRPTIGIYGDHVRDRRRVSGENPDRGRQMPAAEGKVMAREAMEMPWASWHGLSEAIPPAYTEFMGGWLIEYLEAAAA